MQDRLRRLDALFAEKVLGLAVFEDRGCMVYVSYSGGDYSSVDRLPPYTRSLDAAWEGVTKLQADGFNVVKLVSDSEWQAHQQYYAVIYNDDEPTPDFTYCDHPAEALVLACLRAVGCSEEELA